MAEKKIDYERYLESEHWRTFRDSVLVAHPRCERCNLGPSWSQYFYGQSLNVHHLTYENLGHESPSDVEVLCIACHAKEHGKPAPELFSRPMTWLQTFAAAFAFPEVNWRERRRELTKQGMEKFVNQ
jgi:hypothetical protein